MIEKFIESRVYAMSPMTADTLHSVQFAPPLVEAPFPLENGDRLTREEFLRRWDAMPQLKRAELIEGIVYMTAAVRLPQHGRPQGWLVIALGTYAMQTGVDFGDNTSVELDADNVPQPDVCLFLPAALGGKAFVNASDYLEGPPDLVGEVAASTASIDLHAKFNAYRRNGVREYVVWRVLDAAVDWFVLRNGAFVPHPPEGTVFKSTVFPGLWVDAEALIRQDYERLRAALDSGMQTSEYHAFAAQMRKHTA
jgi:Uma2 family endonuclease